MPFGEDPPVPQGDDTLPDIKQARSDHADFFNLTRNAQTPDDARTLDPKARRLGVKAGEIVNIIFQDAGKIPDRDPRHEIFDIYNKIAEKWFKLAPPKRPLE